MTSHIYRLVLLELRSTTSTRQTQMRQIHLANPLEVVGLSSGGGTQWVEQEIMD